MKVKIHFSILTAALLVFLLYFIAAVGIGYCKEVTTTATYSKKPDTLAIILVEFTDVRHDSFFTGGFGQSYHLIHQWKHFYDMLVRRDYYKTPDLLDPHSKPRSPDGEPVFGSFTDYFDAMSNNRYQLTVVIENDSTADGYPVWAQIKQTKVYFSTHETEFGDSAIAAAQRAGLDMRMNEKRRICFIYAGNRWNSIGPAAFFKGDWMRVHERWTWPYDQEEEGGSKKRLTHIGMYCHEFTHLLGEVHHGSGGTRTVSLWDIMGNGQKRSYGGSFGNCPAPIDPWWRYQQGWLDLHFLTGDATKTLVYNDPDNNYYVWNVPGSNESFLIENRQFSRGYDRGLPGSDSTASGGLLIWHIVGDGSDGYEIDLIEADGDEGELSAAVDIFRSDGSNPYQRIDDYSTPANLRLRDGSLSHFAIDSYVNNGNSITVDFKTSELISTSAKATALNNSRKLVRDSAGKYHLVYETEGEIYYQYSTDNATTWSGFKRLSHGTGECKFPCIEQRSGKIYVVWQWYWGEVNSHFVYFSRSINSGINWRSAKVIASNVSANDPLPVIASPAPDELMVVYRSGNNLEWKRSADNGKSWTSSGVITAGNGEALNSPSITATRLPSSNNVIGLAYATNELPNESHIITRYYSYGVWSSANNISNGLPGYLSQHAHPSVSHSGEVSADYQHVTWDAYSSSCRSRVIIHRPGTAWRFNNQYWKLLYQSEDSPIISGLAGNTARVAYQREKDFSHLMAQFDGSNWSVQFPPKNGFHPSFSVGDNSEKYVYTTKGSNFYTVNVSSKTLSKLAADDSVQMVYQRSFALIDTMTGGWFEVGVKKMEINTARLPFESIDFVTISNSLKITPTNGVDALSSQPIFVPGTAESLIVYYMIGGEKLATIKNSVNPVKVELQVVAANGSTFSMPVYATEGDTIGIQEIRVAMAVAPFAGQQITITTQVSDIASNTALIASLKHINQAVDLTNEIETPVYSPVAAPPENFELQAYPNPFNPNTEIRFAIKEAGWVTMRVHNIQGQLVKELLNQFCPAGDQIIRWDGKNDWGNDVASGVYVCHFDTGSFVASKKLTLIR